MIRRCPRQYCLHSLARFVSHTEIRRPTNSRHVAAADAALDVTVNETFMLDVFGLSDLHTHEVRNGSTQIKGQVKSGIKTQNSPSYGKTCSSTGWLASGAVEGGRSSTGRAHGRIASTLRFARCARAMGARFCLWAGRPPGRRAELLARCLSKYLVA